MKNHFLLMTVFSALVSLAFSFLTKNGAKERVRYFFYVFCSFVLLSLLASWVMYAFPF